MIQPLDALTGLAIVGISVVLPDGGDLHDFGRLIYRNLPEQGQFEAPFGLIEAVSRSMQQVRERAQAADLHLPMVCLSEALLPALQKNNRISRVQPEEDLINALLVASDWLESGTEDLVLLVEAHTNPAAVSSVLLAQSAFARENSRQVIALISAAVTASEPLRPADICAAVQSAGRISAVSPDAIGLLKTPGLVEPSFEPNFNEQQAAGLLEAFGGVEPLDCALAPATPGLLGLAEASWCLSQRVLPGVPAWNGPSQPGAWQNSPLYVPTYSRPWFIPDERAPRHTGLNMLSPGGSFTHILLSEPASTAPLSIVAPSREEFRLFPLASASAGDLLETLTGLHDSLASATTPAATAQAAYRRYLLELPTAQYVVSLVARSHSELLREIEFALKGIPSAIDTNSDWHTPQGSAFTAHPLARDGQVAFVYPGAFNSYPGVGRDLFYLFPNLYNRLSTYTHSIGDLLNERLLYPRSIFPLTADDLTSIEGRLASDPVTMIISGSCLAVLYTELLRTVFELHPSSAFGYSLGELSMLYASRVWTTADRATGDLRASPLFRTRLSGPQNALREYWGLPVLPENDPGEALWTNTLLMLGPDQVREALAEEARVYLTHINTPSQVVIGGDPAASRRLIERLKCKSIRAPFNYPLHCEPIQSELDLLEQLHSLPVMGQPDIRLYSAATYQRMPFEGKKIASQIAHALTHCLDFPRLIQRAYADGARIFIELGAGGNCAHWVHDSLHDQPHAAYSINRRGVDDHLGILRLLAHLVAQHVPLNLGALYQE